MMTNKFIPGVSLFFCLTLASCGGAKHTKSQASLPGTWSAQPVIIDGDSKDWPSPYPNYDAKGKIAYATSNDGQYLYITMETGDELTQLKILKEGMTVSIDTTGKKDARFNISYPLPGDSDPLENMEILKETKYVHLGKQWQPKIDRMAKDANQLSLDGFNGCAGGYLVKQVTPCGIKVRMAIDEYKELVWEAAIPFKAIYGRENISAADAGKPISVCYSIKGFKRAQAKGEENAGSAMNNNSSSMGAGGMQHNSGARGGGGRAGRSVAEDPMQHLYESTKTWKHFGVAYQQ